jgi:hypothetical protein
VRREKQNKEEKMKKVFSVLMVCAFAISATAQWLIYDYKVSIKRIDAQYSKLSYKIDEFDAKIPKGAGCPNYVTGYFDSFTTANDTLTGYIVMPACKPCGGMWKQFGSAGFMPANEDRVWINAADESKFAGAKYFQYIDWQDAFDVAKFVDDDTVVYETSYAYIQRKGDKLYSNPLKNNPNYGSKSKTISNKLTWKTPVNVDAARFGKGAGARLSSLYYADTDPDCPGVFCTCREWVTDPTYAAVIARWYAVPTHAKPVKEAWMVLTYDIQTWIGTDVNNVVVPNNASSRIYPPVKNLGIDPCCTPSALTYGLVGYQAQDGSISHAGFGKVTTTGTPGSTSVGFCGSVTVDPTTCTAVNSISGTIAGLFKVSGFCSLAPQWDICYYFKEDGWTGNVGNKFVAPVSGNWTLKLNQSESKKYGASFDSAEARVMDKLKCYPLSTWKTELRANFIYNSSAAANLDDYLY